MVATGQLLAFVATTFVLVVTPGPSVLFTVGRALSVGGRAALLTVAGNAAGVYVQVVAVAVGLGALVASSTTVFTVVKLAGAAYLIYLGVQAIRHRHPTDQAVGSDAVRTRRVLREGFVVGVTNPKMIVFLAAALPQFVDRGAGQVALQMLVLGAAVPPIALLSDSAWAVAAGAARDWFSRSPRRIGAIGGAGGLAMIGVGISLAVSGRKD